MLAWRDMTNQDIAARIAGYIRQAAIGDPLVPYEQRLDHAPQELLASRSWTTPQRQGLQKIAAQPKANVVVDRDAMTPISSSSAKAAALPGSIGSSAASSNRCPRPSMTSCGRSLRLEPFGDAWYKSRYIPRPAPW
jgi:hypothetical protein